MNEMLENLRDIYYDFQPMLLPFLKFVGIIIAGTVAVLVVSKIIRKILHGLSVDEWVASLIPKEEDTAPIKVEEPASRLVLIVGMLFVALVAFRELPFSFVSDSLDRAFGKAEEYGYLVAGAVILLVVGSFIAMILRLVVHKLLEVLALDRWLRKTVGDSNQQISVAKPLSEVAYWAVMVMIMLQVLKILKLESILEPIEAMLRRFFEFVPNLVLAIVILYIGMYAMKMAKVVISRSLSALGADKLGEHAGLNKVFGPDFLSRIGGWLVYALGMIAVVVASLTKLNLGDVTGPLVRMLEDLLGIIPLLLGGAVVLTLTFVVARFLSGLSKGALENAGFDALMDRIGLWREQEQGADSASSLASKLVFLGVLVLGSIQVLEVFQFAGLAGLLTSFVKFAGQVLLGLLILAVGFFIADWAERLVHASKVNQKELLGSAAKVSVWVLSGIMALDQMNMANATINIAFAMILGGLALGSALAFGLGGQGLAKQALDNWNRELRKPTKSNTKKSAPKAKKKSKRSGRRR